MTSPADPPPVRERAAIGSLRSRGTFQVVFAVVLAGFAVVAALSGATWVTVAIAALAAVLLAGSGLFAHRLARRRVMVLEEREGPGAGLPPRRAAGPAD